MSLLGSCAVGAIVIVPFVVVSNVVGGTDGWVILFAGGVAIGLALGLLSRRHSAR
jgi:hypothetical protein